MRHVLFVAAFLVTSLSMASTAQADYCVAVDTIYPFVSVHPEDCGPETLPERAVSLPPCLPPCLPAP